MGFRNDTFPTPAGYQAFDYQTSNNATSSTTYVNCWPSYSFTALVPKTYLLGVDVQCTATALTAGRCTVFFQVLVNSTAYPIYENIDMLSMTPYYNASMRTPVPFVTGSNTIQLQWAVDHVTSTVTAAGFGSRVFSIIA